MQITTPRTVVENINKTPTKCVVITTGGGAGVFDLLLNQGGGSNTLLSGLIPYSNKEVINLLKFTPDKFCSEQTARQLAMAAYLKARGLANPDEPVIGVACTASLQGVPSERNGRTHSIYVALQTRNSTQTASLTLTSEDVKGVFDKCLNYATAIRYLEEEISAYMILNALAKGCQVEHRIEVLPGAEEKIKYDGFYSEKLGDILEGKIRYSGFLGTEPFSLDGWFDRRSVIFPGSFNPIHQGHLEMAELIAKKDKKVIFEISLSNADKGMLDFITVRDRLLKINNLVLITNAPLFTDKSRLFPDVSFIVGHDTYKRVLSGKYGEIDHVCSMFEGNRNYFYIFPRGEGPMGIFGNDIDTVLPGEFVVEPRKYEHVSSTEVREKRDEPAIHEALGPNA
jgi:nicotinamide mononucleotide (NMN) deamidase PncC